MNFEAPRIETDRLILRGRTPADFPAFAKMQADAEFQRFIARTPVSEEDAWAKFLRMHGHWSMLGYGTWVIEDRRTGAFLGEAGFLEARRDATPSHIGTPEAGWGLAPSAWGKGVASEAMKAALAWGDAHLPGGKTCCIIDEDNAASIGVAQRAGYLQSHRAVYRNMEMLVFERASSAAR